LRGRDGRVLAIAGAEGKAVTENRKYYYDLHVHTKRYSPCSNIDPEQVIAAARARGLDGIALTEHSRLWTREQIDELRAATECTDFSILVGAEIRVGPGGNRTSDLLVFGCPSLPPEPSPIDRACRAVRDRQGIVIAPHPYAGPIGIGEEVYSTVLDGIEVYNYRYRGRLASRLAEHAWLQLGVAGVASSDAHELGEIGRFCTEFDAPIANERDLIEAILSQRCRPRRKPPPGQLRRLLGWGC
jgi:predicted metal-dependent phosphoesterase TrpH